jgi:hypothetical protein
MVKGKDPFPYIARLATPHLRRSARYRPVSTPHREPPEAENPPSEGNYSDTESLQSSTYSLI